MKKVFLILALCPFKAHASIIRPDANLVEWFLGSAIAGTILYTMAYGGGKLFEVLMRVFEPKRWENAKKNDSRYSKE